MSEFEDKKQTEKYFIAKNSSGKSIADDDSANVLDDVLSSFGKKQTVAAQAKASAIRLNKAIAEAGICSRRQADILIERGSVRVNGEIIREMGHKVFPGDKLEVRGEKAIVRATASSADGSGQGENNQDVQRKLIYIILHKPTHVVSTASDPEGRQTVLDFLPDELKAKRLYPVGRLDYFSEGLIILTNDGELTQRLTHPKYHLPKYYRVVLREEPKEHQLTIMRKGMTLKEGEELAPVEVSLLAQEEANNSGHTLEMVLHQGINRQIRRMCRDLGLTILRLMRMAQGPIKLGELPVGKTRHLSAEEVKSLKKAVGLE